MEKKTGDTKTQSKENARPPVFVDDSAAAQFDNFEPCPRLYECAAEFIAGTAEKAFLEGDNDYLIREGIAETLEFLADEKNAGAGAAVNDLILSEIKIENEMRARDFKKFSRANEAIRKTRRAAFWRIFDATGDNETIKTRAAFLASPKFGELLTLAREAAKTDNSLFDSITDGLIFFGCNEKLPNPARARATWLNRTFLLAGEYLAQWLNIAAASGYNAQLSEIKKSIADNFGVFPAPFSYESTAGGEYVYLARNELKKLVYIARALRREKQPEPQPQKDKSEISQENFANLLFHWKGEKRGKPYDSRSVINWEQSPEQKRKFVIKENGEKWYYSADIRQNRKTAENWARLFNEQNANIIFCKTNGLGKYTGKHALADARKRDPALIHDFLISIFGKETTENLEKFNLF